MRLAHLPLGCVLAASPLAAQRAATPALSYDLALGVGGGLQSGSAGVVRRHALLSGGHLIVGYGLRASLLTGTLKLTPAGAKNVPVGFVDTLTVERARVMMLNASAHVAVKLAEPVEVGLNIDIAGVGTGGSTSGTYRASSLPAVATVSASPASPNLFLYGSNDKGSLNSEFYAAWRVNPSFTIRAGLSHFLAEYKAERALSSNTDRFRRYSNLAFGAVRWTPGRQ